MRAITPVRSAVLSAVLCAAMIGAGVAAPRTAAAQTDTVDAVVAAQQRSLDSLLRALRSSDWTGTRDPLQLLVLRYTNPRVKLTNADSTRAMARFIAAASAPEPFTRLRLPFLAERIPLPELVPLLKELADEDQTHIDPDADEPPLYIREAALSAATNLIDRWFAMRPGPRLAALEREVAASCLAATGSLGEPCALMHAALRRFRRHMEDSDSAKSAIRDFQRAVERAAAAGLSRTTVPLLAGNAELLETSTFHITVDPRLVRSAGDTITMTYTAHVISPASDSLEELLVDAPTLLHINQPGGDSAWHIGSRIGSRSVAGWRHHTHYFIAGESTPALPVTSRGLLGIVAFWGWMVVPMDSVISDMPSDNVRPDTVVDLPGPRGSTVGVVAMPVDLSPGALAKRLAGLIKQSCELGWIDDRTACAELHARAQPSAVSLRALLRSLEAQHGIHVTDAAYLLLAENARFLLARL